MKKRVLLIEDDRWLAQSYVKVLGDYRVDIVRDGYDAIEKVSEHIYSVIIADVMIEWGTVIGFLHELQSYADTQKLPVIVCTNIANQLQPDDLRVYGVVEVIDKAVVTSQKLRSSIEEAISG